MRERYLYILGLGTNASDQEIKRAYRRMAMMYHPDKNTRPEAREMFEKVTEAYQYLQEHPYDTVFFTTREPIFEKKQVDQRELWRKQERERRRKQKEAAELERMKTMLAITKMLNYFVAVVAVISLVFVLDYYLPYGSRVEQVLGAEDEVLLSEKAPRIEFETGTLRGDRWVNTKLPERGQEALVSYSRVLHTVISARFGEGADAVMVYRKAPLSVVVFFAFLNMILIALYAAIRRRPDIRISVSLFVLVLVIIAIGFYFQ